MLRRSVLAALVALGAVSAGCSPGTPATWALTIEQFKSEPAAPTPDTPVFIGSGRADLGKLPAGKHAVTVTLQPQGGWATPPPQTIEVVVVGGG